jgi:dihydroneopterin aldolase/2-amino-4-hydroxy-6-hydroxymethyldihydropteridine diphosphokinase
MLDYSDRINIKGLKLYAYHGCLEEERQKGQEFTLDITLYLNLTPAGITDNLERTVNYSEACQVAQEAFTKYAYNLIETAAEEVAAALLIKYSLVDKVTVEVFKPHAPIPLDFENVSVFIERKRHTAYIAVGSNLGESEATIAKARELFLKVEGNEILAESSLIVTKPYGVTDQPDFINGMWKVSTLLPPYDLLKKLNEIEHRLGRERLIHWGPRTIDLDIIYYDNLVIDSEKLTVPHIDMANREFVLKPLLEVDPYVRHPITGLRAQEMLDKLN